MYLFTGAGALDFGGAVRYADDDLVQLTVQRLTDQVKVFEVDPLRYLMVQLIDGGRPSFLDSKILSIRAAPLCVIILQLCIGFCLDLSDYHAIG